MLDNVIENILNKDESESDDLGEEDLTASQNDVMEDATNIVDDIP